jgi:hypothetical protein
MQIVGKEKTCHPKKKEKKFNFKPMVFVPKKLSPSSQLCTSWKLFDT